MKGLSLDAVAGTQVIFDGRFRQIVLNFTAGQGLPAHDNPGSATLQVLRGRVRLTAAGEMWEGIAGDHVAVPDDRHELLAVEDAAVLLTVVHDGR